MKAQEKGTPLHEIGERGLIEKIRQRFASSLSLPLRQGIGDDAAVLEENGKAWLMSTDMLIEGVHFDLSYMPLQHLGYKAVVVNVSDIIAMNGQAEYLTVSIGLSNRFSVEAVEALYDGIAQACKTYKLALIGGDTCASPRGLILSMGMMGSAKSTAIAYRHGAKENDRICLTGDMGRAYVGLEILKREKEGFLKNSSKQPALEAYTYLIERQLKPEARTDVYAYLAARGIKPHAMIDTSDGLSSDLTHLCTASKIGAEIEEEKLPLHALTIQTAHELGLDPLTCALHGGEDYQLLFTVSEEDYQKIAPEHDISAIGRMRAKHLGAYLLKKDNNTVSLDPEGWSSF